MLPVVDALQRLIQARLDELGWSQAELARRSGVKPQTISSWMSGARAKGSRGPSPDKLRAVANALSLPVIQVFEAAGRTVPPELSPDEERRLLGIFRELSSANRELSLDQMQLLLDRDRRN